MNSRERCSECGCSCAGAEGAAAADDSLVKLDSDYVDLILAMETMFPTEVSGAEAAADGGASASLEPIEEDAPPQLPPAIEPVIVPTDPQSLQESVDQHSPNV